MVWLGFFCLFVHLFEERFGFLLLLFLICILIYNIHISSSLGSYQLKGDMQIGH